MIVEIIGVVAFAISGALVAIDKKMDVFGVVTLGVVTSTGGGVIRDLILGINPPIIFVEPIFAFVAIFTSLVMFLKPVRTFVNREKHIFDVVVFVADTVGLSLFAMSGLRIAYDVSINQTLFLLCFVGLISGTGGSVLRDMLAGQTPFIFIKHFYACATLIGSFVASLLMKFVNPEISMICGGCVIAILRVCAANLKWSLPRA